MAGYEVFDDSALEYDRWFESHKSEYASELKAIRRFLPEGRGVEVGAGTGRFAVPLGVSLGVEPAKAMRDIATARGVNVIAGVAESLPLDDGSYDYVLFVTTVCFLDSPETAFKESFRILKPGGYIIIGMIDRNSPTGRQYQEKRMQSRFYRHARFHSVEEIRDDLSRAGFGNTEYLQTLLPGRGDEKYMPVVKPGYGEGGFVVLRARSGPDPE